MIRRNSNRKLTLEQRITRLENALRSNKRVARKFEGGGDVAELKSLLNNVYDADYTPLHVSAAGGKIYVDYGPDDDDIYREFQLLPSAGGWTLMSDGDEIGNPVTMQDAADMIVDTISDDAWDL